MSTCAWLLSASARRRLGSRTTDWCSLSNGLQDEPVVMATATYAKAGLKRVLLLTYEVSRALTGVSKAVDAAARRLPDWMPA